MTDGPTVGLAAAPAIIIFGAGLRPDGTPSPTLSRRVDAALAFGRRWPDALYLPTGGVGRFGPSEAQAMAARMKQAGIRGSCILLEETATDTFDSVLACRALLQQRDHRGAIYAATSAYHLPRCLALLWLAGVTAKPVPPPDFAAASGWRKRWYWRLREVPALPWDVLLMLLRRGK